MRSDLERWRVSEGVAREGSEREKAVQIRIGEHKYTPYHAPPPSPPTLLFFGWFLA